MKCYLIITLKLTTKTDKFINLINLKNAVTRNFFTFFKNAAKTHRVTKNVHIFDLRTTIKNQKIFHDIYLHACFSTFGTTKKLQVSQTREKNLIRIVVS